MIYKNFLYMGRVDRSPCEVINGLMSYYPKRDKIHYALQPDIHYAESISAYNFWHGVELLLQPTGYRLRMEECRGPMGEWSFHARVEDNSGYIPILNLDENNYNYRSEYYTMDGNIFQVIINAVQEFVDEWKKEKKSLIMHNILTTI